jgi:hypothetical protein
LSLIFSATAAIEISPSTCARAGARLGLSFGLALALVDC